MPVYENRALNDPLNELYTANVIARFSKDGEVAFARDCNCILKRVALTIVSGTASYTLPNDVKSIRRITYKGTKLDPLGQRAYRNSFGGLSSTGKPYWYVFNNITQNTIQLFPTPNENIATAITDDLWGAAIETRVIVEYYCIPDSVTTQLPSYFRRRLLKVYVQRGCYNIEGRGQNLKIANYFKKRWTYLSLLYTNALAELHDKPRKLVLRNTSGTEEYPASAVLPISRFGTSVDIGE